jgi:outer membrane protein insertion porin family
LKSLNRYQGIAIIAVFICIFIATVTPVAAESNPTVLMVDVHGNTHVPAEKVLGVVSNSKMGEPLDAQKVELDMKSIMELGYFADVKARTEKMFDGVELIFEVVENPAFKEVQITGLTKIKPDELKPFFTQKTGEVFNTAIFRQDLSNALKHFQEKKGLVIQPKAVGNLGISADGVVKLELVELRFGKIKVNGLIKTKEFVVLRELTFKEGDIIDYNVLRNDLQSIMRLRLFDKVEPHMEQGATPNTIDLTLEVQEAQTGTFSFGVSFAQSTGEFGGVLGYSEGNLMGLGQNIALDLDYAESKQNAQFSFYEPWLDDKKTSFGLSMWNTDSEFVSTMNSWFKKGGEDQYDLHLIETGISLSFGRPLWKDYTSRVQFNFQRNTMPNNEIRPRDEDENDDSNNSDGSANTDSANLKRPLEFWDNSIGLDFTKNKLIYQDRNFVNGGYQLSFNHTVSGEYLGGEFNYQKSTLEGKWFHAFTPNLVIGTRLQGTTISGEYPDYNALYLGGMYRLRGYADRRFDSQLSEQLIGTKYLLSNTELRYRLPKNDSLEFVLFYDAGQINNMEGGSTFKADYGVGFRYNVPLLGVLRFDQAWNVNKEDGSRFVISLGEMF